MNAKLNAKPCRRVMGLLAACVVPALTLSTAGAASTPTALADYGVSLALGGNSSRAESVFVSMLSHTRGDARALNNLGNLKLLKGDLGVALAFYENAARADSTDAGIQLNRATVLLLMGDQPRAEAAATSGVRLAGGLAQAQALIGLKNEGEAPKGDKQAFLNKNEIRALLRKAATSVPSDTTRRGSPGGKPASGKKPASTWVSGGPRAADDSDAAKVLYWKR